MPCAVFELATLVEERALQTGVGGSAALVVYQVGDCVDGPPSGPVCAGQPLSRGGFVDLNEVSELLASARVVLECGG